MPKYRVTNTCISYGHPEKHAHEGDVVDDLPAGAAAVFLENGDIEKVEGPGASKVKGSHGAELPSR